MLGCSTAVSGRQLDAELTCLCWDVRMVILKWLRHVKPPHINVEIHEKQMCACMCLCVCVRVCVCVCVCVFAGVVELLKAFVIMAGRRSLSWCEVPLVQLNYTSLENS